MILLRPRHLASALLLALSIGGALGTPASAQKAETARVTIATPWSRATPGNSKIGVAFLEVQARKGHADKLLSASSPVAGVVELHTHTSDNGVMRMRRIDAIDVPAGGKAVLKPGGLHLMLMNLKHPLKEGDKIDLTLVFEKAGKIAVKVPVLKVGSPGPGGMAHGAGSAGAHSGHGAHGKH